MQRDARNQGVSPTTPGHLHFEAICFDKKIAIRGRHTVYGQPYVVAHVNRPGSARDGDDKKYARLFCASPDLLAALIESRTTLLMLKRNVETEIRSHDGLFRWEGVPEAIHARIVQCDAAISRATGEVQS